jgi:hypothetical protein
MSAPSNPKQNISHLTRNTVALILAGGRGILVSVSAFAESRARIFGMHSTNRLSLIR